MVNPPSSAIWTISRVWWATSFMSRLSSSRSRLMASWNLMSAGLPVGDGRGPVGERVTPKAVEGIGVDGHVDHRWPTGV